MSNEVKWTVNESKVPGYERVISVADGNLGICRMDGGGSSNPKVLAEVRANADLIAAAPELLSAARSALEHMTYTSKECPECISVVKQLEAAITKAEGA